MLARIVFTSSYGASTELTPVVSIVQRWSLNVTFAPSTSSTRANVRVSSRFGTLRRRCATKIDRGHTMSCAAMQSCVLALVVVAIPALPSADPARVHARGAGPVTVTARAADSLRAAYARDRAATERDLRASPTSYL